MSPFKNIARAEIKSGEAETCFILIGHDGTRQMQWIDGVLATYAMIWRLLWNRIPTTVLDQ